jgi:hypothetical protein
MQLNNVELTPESALELGYRPVTQLAILPVHQMEHLGIKLYNGLAKLIERDDVLTQWDDDANKMYKVDAPAGWYHLLLWKDDERKEFDGGGFYDQPTFPKSYTFDDEVEAESAE